MGNRAPIAPDSSLTHLDRVVPGLPGYSQVLLFTRIDLKTRRYDMRQLNLDLGPSYFVLTDNQSVLDRTAESMDILERSREKLKRYDDLFSAASSLIYLPVFFMTRHADVRLSNFVTELGVRKKDKPVRDAVRIIGKKYAPYHRTVRCLALEAPASQVRQDIEAPVGFRSSLTGHWKDLPANEIGEDENGAPIVGKTWVETFDSWSATQPESFLLRFPEARTTGPDPGVIYVMRSASHERDIFKVGLTRRDSATRASELSQATGVPLPFGVIAHWHVDDCSASEKAIHDRLTQFRISTKREFFRTSLSIIVAAIEEIVAAPATA